MMSSQKTLLINDLFNRVFDWMVRLSPEFATSVGIYNNSDELEDMSYEAVTEKRLNVGKFLKEVEALEDVNQLSAEEQLSVDLLRRNLEQFLVGQKFQTYLFPVNQMEGPQTDFPLLVSFMRFKTAQDYDMLFSRFKKFPLQIDQLISLLARGVQEKYVMCRVSVKPVPAQILDLLSKAIEELPFFKPFLNRAAVIDELKWREIVAEGTRLIESAVVPAFQKLATYLESTYIPAARSTISIRDLPNGLEYYQKCLEYHTTSSLTPDEIHNMGKSEVERIFNRMEDLKNSLGYKKDVASFLEYLRTDLSFTFKDKNEALDEYKATCQSVQMKLPLLFKTFPRATFEIKPVPEEIAQNSSGAYYVAPPGDYSRPGVFYLNLHDLEAVKTFETVSLVLHEAVPGHHHQIAINVGLENLPSFRRFFEDLHYYQVPEKFSLYSAYVEGWALYCEYLGEELGLYSDPYDLLGRLSSEILRAVRLVVDTGIHAFGWSYDEAIAFMRKYIPMSHSTVVAEVERYITWPGQACAYKIGELKIKELRKKATDALGEKFDLRDFHDFLLLSGTLPLDVLDRRVNVYIANLLRQSKIINN